MNIYIVTSGEYSDYKIETVFSSQEQAELYCATHEDDLEYPRVEEYAVDEVTLCGSAKLMRRWTAIVNDSGIITNLDSAVTFKSESATVWPCRWPYGGYRVALTMPNACSEDQARKAVFDHIAKYKAEINGI